MNNSSKQDSGAGAPKIIGIIALILLIGLIVYAIVHRNKSQQLTPDVQNSEVENGTNSEASIKDPTTINKSSMDEQNNEQKDSQNNNEQNANSGLQITTVKAGTGTAVKSGDTVTVDYTGKFEDGKTFDSSIGRAPFVFTVGQGQVIKGWEIGVVGMKVGEERTLKIPSDLAYGDAGYPGAIPPKATLMFDIKLIKIN